MSAPVGVEAFTEKHGVDLRGITIGEVLTQDQWDAVCAFVREQESIIDDRDERLEALAQQPAAGGGFTAADMMDARKEGRKEAQQLAADPLVEWANSPLNFTATVGVYKDGVQPAAVDGAMALTVDDVKWLQLVRQELFRRLDVAKSRKAVDNIDYRIAALDKAIALAAKQGERHDHR